MEEITCAKELTRVGSSTALLKEITSLVEGLTLLACGDDDDNDDDSTHGRDDMEETEDWSGG